MRDVLRQTVERIAEVAAKTLASQSPVVRATVISNNPDGSLNVDDGMGGCTRIAANTLGQKAGCGDSVIVGTEPAIGTTTSRCQLSAVIDSSGVPCPIGPAPPGPTPPGGGPPPFGPPPFLPPPPPGLGPPPHGPGGEDDGEIKEINLYPSAFDTLWVNAAITGPGDTWDGSRAYVFGDFAALGGVSYKCSLANTGVAPPNATYWGSVGTIASPWANRSTITPVTSAGFFNGDILAGATHQFSNSFGTALLATNYPNVAVNRAFLEYDTAGRIPAGATIRYAYFRSALAIFGSTRHKKPVYILAGWNPLVPTGVPDQPFNTSGLRNAAFAALGNGLELVTQAPMAWICGGYPTSTVATVYGLGSCGHLNLGATTVIPIASESYQFINRAGKSKFILLGGYDFEGPAPIKEPAGNTDDGYVVQHANTGDGTDSAGVVGSYARAGLRLVVGYELL